MIDNKQYAFDIVPREKAFLGRLLDHSQQAVQYGDETLQALARSLIPVERLESEVIEAEGDSVKDKEDVFREQLLLRMMRWFKLEFFRWTDAPSCLNCQGRTKSIGALSPFPEELANGARRIEGYFCDQCRIEVRFPRYNNPGKLLETRCGRCGEWANCFTLCSQALGYDSRFVVDFTDHVWTEVWIETKQRWVHYDPCENVCDRPLLYEHGWNKKLTYVIAFSPTQIVDVTWRYTAKFEVTLSRRLECRENRLIDFIDDFNQSKMKCMSSEQKGEYLRRAVSEVAELLCSTKVIREGEDAGRSSGSLEWRRARGEQGKAKAEQSKHVVLSPEKEEIEAKEFLMTYDPVHDKYERPLLGKTIRGWNKGAFSSQKVQRKEEFDWKFVYLSRTEGADVGEISWKVDLSKVELEIVSVEIKVLYTTFENGRVRFTCCCGDSCTMLKNGLNMLDSGFEKANEVLIGATMEGGTGNNAWQHTQLFRMPFTSPINPFEIRIRFK